MPEYHPADRSVTRLGHQGLKMLACVGLPDGTNSCRCFSSNSIFLLHFQEEKEWGLHALAKTALPFQSSPQTQL